LQFQDLLRRAWSRDCFTGISTFRSTQKDSSQLLQQDQLSGFRVVGYREVEASTAGTDQ
jgi:hypothetical protein